MRVPLSHRLPADLTSWTFWKGFASGWFAAVLVGAATGVIQWWFEHRP